MKKQPRPLPGNIEYVLPLAADDSRYAFFELPVDLTSADFTRISNFLHALVMDGDTLAEAGYPQTENEHERPVDE